MNDMKLHVILHFGNLWITLKKILLKCNMLIINYLKKHNIISSIAFYGYNNHLTGRFFFGLGPPSWEKRKK